MTEIQQTSTAPTPELSAHLAKFLQLTEQLDDAVKSGKDEEKDKVQKEINVFFGSLSSTKQNDIRIFLIQQHAGRRIESYRSKTHRAISEILQFPVVLAHNITETIPHLTRETVDAIVSTVGMIGVGAYRGGKKVVDAFRQAA